MRIMTTLFQQISDRISDLEHWFDLRFGWFFTNGMKEWKRAGRARFKA